MIRLVWVFTMAQRRAKRLSIAIPSSVVDEWPHQRDKTLVLGLIARASAVFRVDRIIIYRDPFDRAYAQKQRFVQSVLSYAETPQYLRKALHPISRDLRYVGVIPPLRTPHHPLAKKSSELAERCFREGVVVGRRGGLLLVDVGVEKPIPCEGRAEEGARVTVELVRSGQRLLARIVDRSLPQQYWGYEVEATRMLLGEYVLRSKPELAIATSRYGISIVDAWHHLREGLSRSREVLVAFGTPTRGIFELMDYENLKVSDVFHFTVNTIPRQGTETVRVEEALLISLGLLNVLMED